MNGKKQNPPVKIENSQEQLVEHAKTFRQDSFNIDYVNTSRVLEQRTSYSLDVEVRNYLCYQDGSSLCKITQIFYEDKLVRIEDKLKINCSLNKAQIQKMQMLEKSNNLELSRKSEKLRIFVKNKQQQSQCKKKDKKNTVKNIVKIFISWLEKKQRGSRSNHFEIALAQLKQLLKNEKFNNRLIKAIAATSQISQVFLQFVLDDAPDQIKYSRIQDKDSHYEALSVYSRLLGDESSKLNIEQKLEEERSLQPSLSAHNSPTGNNMSKQKEWLQGKAKLGQVQSDSCWQNCSVFEESEQRGN